MMNIKAKPIFTFKDMQKKYIISFINFKQRKYFLVYTTKNVDLLTEEKREKKMWKDGISFPWTG